MKRKIFTIITIISLFLPIFSFSIHPASASDALYQWTKTFGGTGSDSSYSVSLDADNNVYVTGTFQNSFDFNPGTGEEEKDEHVSAGSTDIFLSKYTSSGEYQWTQTVGGTGNDFGYSVSLDANNNVYITGFFQNTVDFDPGDDEEERDERVSAGSNDIFLSKYTSSGEYQWTQTVGGIGTDISLNVSAYANGNVYISGHFQNTVDFDSGTGEEEKDEHVSAGGYDIFLSKYTNSGEYEWTKSTGGIGTDYTYSLSADANGNAYISGLFSNTVDFNPGVGEEEKDERVSAGSNDIFLSKYTSSGEYEWTQTVGGTGGDSGYSVSLDADNNVYLTGVFQNTVDFDPGAGEEEKDERVFAGGYDIFLSKYTSIGEYQWTQTVGGTGNDQSYSVSLDADNNVYVTGYFENTVDFDPGVGEEEKDERVSVGGVDIFLFKYTSSGEYEWTKTVGGTGNDLGRSVSLDADNNVYVTGYFRNTVDFNPGAGEEEKDERVSAGSSDIFLSKYALDDAAPAISLTTSDNYTQNITPSLLGTATDVLGTVTSVEYQMDGILGSWIACESNDEIFDEASEAFTCSVSPALSEGTHTIYVRATDSHTNTTAFGSETADEFIVDTTAPTGTISINSGETITNTDEVTLTLSATDNLTEVKKMMVSNKGDYSGASWETYNPSKEWRLSVGDGEKRVYVKYRDEVGNISESYEDSIEMDMGAPTGTLIINEGEEYTSSREVVLHITGEDEVTGVEEMRISEERTMEGVEWEGYETSREYTLSEGDGYKVIYIQYRDGIGNESEVYGSNITLDSQTEIDITEIGEEEVEGEIVNWETKETTPTFTGEGEVGATITIEIEGIETGTVVVNEDGVWSWTPSIELTRGQEYNITIISTDLAGNEDIKTFILGISDEEVIEVNQTTPEAQITTTQLPNTGVIFIIGLMLMGGLLWTGMNFKVMEKLGRKVK